jgi:hypothetical protein
VEYRNKANLTQKDVVTALDWSESKLHRIENGPARIQTSDILVMLTLYGVHDANERLEVVELGRLSRMPSVSTRYGKELDPKYVEFLDYEHFADRYYSYQTKLIPGVLQWGGYAAAVAERMRFRSDEEKSRVIVDARSERSEYLTGPEGPTAEFIVDESALHRAIGGEDNPWDLKYSDMESLIAHLKERNTQGRRSRGEEPATKLNPNMSVRIVPYELGAYPALQGPFVLLEFDDPKEKPLVYLENPDRQEIVRDPELIEAYRAAFQDLSKAIPGADETDAILDYILKDFKRRLKEFPSKVGSKRER